MKFVAAIFFIVTLPLIIFITTVLYGGFSTSALKEELAKSGMYAKIISVANKPQDKKNLDESDQLFALLQSHLTPDYLQTKVEGVIDDTALWATGKSQTAPILSFKDIKDDLTAKNPTLLADIQNMSQEMKKAQAAENNQEVTASNQPDPLETFVKNDFSFPLTDSLAGVKQSYTVLSIAFPILIILLMLSLVGIGMGNHTWKMRFRWFGITFLISSVLGFVSILFYRTFADASLKFILEQKDHMLQIIYPLLERTVLVFINQYTIYQITTTYILLAGSVIFLIVSFVLKSPKVKPLKK